MLFNVLLTCTVLDISDTQKWLQIGWQSDDIIQLVHTTANAPLVLRCDRFDLHSKQIKRVLVDQLRIMTYHFVSD